MIRRTWRMLRPYLAGRSSWLLVVSALALVSGVAEAVAILLAVRVAVDIGAGETVIRFGQFSWAVEQALFVAFGTEILALVGHAAIAKINAAIGATVLRETRKIAVQRYLDAPWRVQSVQREGALQDLVSALSPRSAELAQWLAHGLTQLLMMGMFVLAAAIVDWRFTAAVLTAGAVVVLALRPLAKATQTRANTFVTANSRYSEEVGRVASGSLELKSFGVEASAREELEDLNVATTDAQAAARFAVLFGGGVFKDIAVLLLVGSVAGLYWVGADALANAGVVVTLIIRSLTSAQQASASYQNVSEGTPNLVEFNKRLLEMPPESPHHDSTTIGTFKSLRLVNVGYRYDDTPENAVRDVNLDIQAGAFVGIVGPSGGGKSTLLQLILRLRRPTEGFIEVNGVDYRSILNENWHDLVSLVPQEPNLLEATVAENIAYYRPISATEVVAAAKSASVHDDITRLPLGYETRLGPRGIGLSGGQKQRIAIARALAGGPSLLIMDEPTSALDIESEKAVLQTIAKLHGSTTMLLVAHRLSTVSQCDYFVRVDNGTAESLESVEASSIE